jgi:hypothetical protein
MSDEACFDFLKSINYDKQYFIDKGWTKKYWNEKAGVCWWPGKYSDVPGEDPNDYTWFPPGFKLVKEGYDEYKGTFPEKCCTTCKNSKGKYSREYAYGCRLPEIRVAYDSSVLHEDRISAGHSNPCFVWDLKFAPHAVCDYFDPVEYNYSI